MNKSKVFWISLVVGGTTSSIISYAQDESKWEISTGVGVIASPVSPGIDEIDTTVIPFLDLTYGDRFFLNFEKGLGANLLTFGDELSVTLSAAIGFAPGRDQDDAFQLRGLGDLDPSAEARFFIDVDGDILSASVAISQGLNSKGHEGLRGSFSLQAKKVFNNKYIIAAGPFATYGDSKYQKAWVGVTPEQALASGYSSYTPESGLFSYGVSASFIYFIDRRWSVFLNVSQSFYSDEVNDSPITTEDDQVSLFSALSYRF